MISPRLVLTAWHVVEDAMSAKASVGGGGTRVLRVVGRDEEHDVALLAVPEDEPGWPDDLVVIPRAYWRGARPERTLVQLSIEEADLPSSVDVDLAPAPPSAHHIEIKLPIVREGIEHGYSGAPVIEPPPGRGSPRLLGIVRARDPLSEDPSGRVGKGWFVPMERIAERLTQVADLVETPIERDGAWLGHWEPRARGVATSRDQGFFFTGRACAYRRLVEHLREGEGLLVVTGNRGCGKSALLARAVTLSCRRYQTLLNGQQPAASGASQVAVVDAAVPARGRPVPSIADQIAQQLGYGACEPEQLVDACARDERLPVVVIDAVDESSDPRALMLDVVVPLADNGVRVAIGALRGHVHDVAQVTTLDPERREHLRRLAHP